MLHVDKISLSFDKKVLDEVTFDLKAGDILGIVGKSGAGKTSLLKILSGYRDSSSGKVTFEGNKVLGPSVLLVPGHPDIQLVNQDFELDLYHTVAENIREKILYLPAKIRDKFVIELIDLVELTDNANQQAITLSGGEQQRLCIARALACEPKLLLLDEPFVHLDMRLKMKITNYLLEMKAIRNMGVIIISHDGAEILSLCDRIIYLKGGKVKRISTPKSAFYNYKTKEEGELYGWVNTAQIDGKRIFFRPDEYQIDDKNPNALQLEYESHSFTGGYYYTSFHVKNQQKNKILLLNLDPLTHVEAITICKKN